MSNKFSAEVIKLAQQNEKEYGVPASVTLAQYALESGYGTSGHAQNHNNYFGMKYRSTYGGNDFYMSNGSKWQEYKSMSDSFEDHAKLLSGDKYSALTKDATTVEQYVNAIAETYAPSSDGNSNYAGKLMSIIKSNNLTQYDSGNYSSTGAVNISQAVTDEEADKPSIFSAEYWQGVLGHVVKFIVLLGVVVLAFILMMKAFNVKLPTKKAIAGKLAENIQLEDGASE